MEVYFSFIKESILTCNYPLSHSMTDEELADIFKTSNRCFLISWILKLLDNTYEEILERSENDKEVLGNMVYELGFCAQKDKLPFMTGQLPFEQQFIKDLSTIQDFVKSRTEISESVAEKDNDVYDMLKLLYQEALSVKKYSRSI
ncbi:hypothetical protein NQ317_009840 [Molorchus minor]|uniref:Uncharacterized protein n=1 Tax=Molorchus minor TaxID=1323400 RepID=A0ABQ9J9S3_9CUCU|nr:hypothetical protein NQ317_009840 [Molorchus minor]